MNQEVLVQASLLQKQSQELTEQLEFIENQISELGDFSSNLVFLSKSDSNDSLSSIGRGVFLKTELREKKLFVDIGSGIIIRKTPDEVVKIVELQIKELNEAKISISSQLEICNMTLDKIIKEIHEDKD